MDTKTTISLAIWDAKKFQWKLSLQGQFESLNGCPNWLHESIRQLKSSGQVRDDTIHIMSANKHQYAVRFIGDTVQIYSKKK